jgi:hypothetical protein
MRFATILFALFTLTATTPAAVDSPDEVFVMMEIPKMLKTYTLTLPNVKSYVSTMEPVTQRRKTDKAFRQETTENMGAALLKTPEQFAKRYPLSAKVYRDAGIAPRDWVLTAFTIMQIQGVLDPKKLTEAERQKEMKMVNPANIAFFKEHAAELKPLLTKLAQLSQERE